MANAVTGGKTFVKGESLTSPNLQYRLTWQTDSNLVVYRVADGAALWNSGTQGTNADTLIYQTDGNLVMYRAGTAIWHTYTDRSPTGSYLAMEDTGKLVMYSPIGAVEWTTP